MKREVMELNADTQNIQHVSISFVCLILAEVTGFDDEKKNTFKGSKCEI